MYMYIYYYYYYYYFILLLVYTWFITCVTFFYQRVEIPETDKTLQNDFTDKDFLPVNRQRWNSITITSFPMYINFQ